MACVCVHVNVLSRVQLFATSRAVACDRPPTPESGFQILITKPRVRQARVPGIPTGEAGTRQAQKRPGALHLRSPIVAHGTRARSGGRKEGAACASLRSAISHGESLAQAAPVPRMPPFTCGGRIELHILPSPARSSPPLGALPDGCQFQERMRRSRTSYFFHCPLPPVGTDLFPAHPSPRVGYESPFPSGPCLRASGAPDTWWGLRLH